MKRNVDLTENRFFSSNNWFNDVAIGVLTLGMITKEKFPWRVSGDELIPITQTAPNMDEVKDMVEDTETKETKE